MIDVREEIAGAPVGRYHRFLALLIGMVVFFDGYDTFNPAYVIHYVMKPWHLAAGLAGWLVSSGLIGFMIGSLLQGKFSDRYGRRATLLAALWVVTIFSFATAALGRSFFTFCGLRLLTGLGMGALLPLGVTYVNEYAPRRLANTFSMWGWALGWAAGGIVAAAIGVYLTPMFGWQALYYAASLSIVLVLICHVALPESLQFSAMRGNWQGIAQVLCRLNPSQSARYTVPGERFMFPEPSDRPASVSLLLSTRYATFTQNIRYAIGEPALPTWLGIKWSLAVEEQFYLILPAVIWFVPRRRLPYVRGSAILAAPLLRLFLNRNYSHGNLASFYLMPCRADALLLGVAAALLVRNQSIWESLKSQRRRLALIWIVLLAGFPYFIFFKETDPILSFWISTVGLSLLAVFYLGLHLLALAYSDGWLGRKLRTP